MSQYKNQITGDVLFHYKALEDKTIDITNYKFDSSNSTPYSSINQIYYSTNTKYSDYSFGLKNTNRNVDPYMCSLGGVKTLPFIPTAVTISWWMYIIENYASNPSVCINFYVNTVDNYGYNVGMEPKSGIMRPMINRFSPGLTKLQPTDFQFSLNTWYHCALILANNQLYYYINGQLRINDTGFSLTNFISAFIATYASNTLFDDFTIIGNQALWTSNFDPPNGPLISPNIPKRMSNKIIIHPKPTNRNDYFDKAYLY